MDMGTDDTEITPDELEPTDASPRLPEDEADFDWDSFANQYFSGSSAVDDDDVEPEPEPEPELAPVAEQPERPSVIEVGGETIPVDEAEQLAALYRYVRDNPDQAMQFAGYLAGQYDLAPKDAQERQPEEQTPPAATPLPPLSDEDLEYLPEPVRQRIQALDQVQTELAQFREEMGSYRQVAQVQYEQAMAQRAAAAQTAIDTGIERFRQGYEVDDTQLEQLIDDAAQLGLASTLTQQYNDPVRGVSEALELAYLRRPELRQQAMARQDLESRREQAKQRKLGALAGSGGAGGGSKAPSTPDEARTAMVSDIRAALGGG